MKKMIIGLVIGLFIGAASTAAAQLDTVQAVFQKFDFVVNGQEQQIDADPLVHQGTTYLPVRVVANMLGYDVTYKASDQRIELISAVEQRQNEQRSENNMEQVIDLDEWISLRDLAGKDSLIVEYGYHQGTGNNLIIRKGDQEFIVPGVLDYDLSPFEVDGGGTLSLKLINGSPHVYIPDLETLGILD